MQIKISNLRQQVRLGCSDEERAFPQIIAMDLELEIEDKNCFKTDRLEDTVDYIQVISRIQSLLQNRSWHLIEKMSHDIGCDIVEKFSKVKLVTVQIKKDVVIYCGALSCTVIVRRE